MARFHFKIDVEPKDIPNLDDSHKRDCNDMLTSVINSTFKYTLIFSIGAVAFFAAFSLFSFTFYMRMGTLLPQITPAVPIICTIVFLLAFIAGTMNAPAMVIETLLCAALIFIFMINWPTIWLMPFAIYATIVNLKLITLIPIHKALSAEPGYPEFTSLPTKEEVAAAKNNKQ